MDNENGVPTPTQNEAIFAEKALQSSYWLDACEDISYTLNSDLSLDATSGFDSADFTSNSVADDPNFFKGIDSILESIKNGTGVPSTVHTTESGVSCESMLLDGHLDSGNRTEYSSRKINSSIGDCGFVRNEDNSLYKFQKHDEMPENRSSKGATTSVLGNGSSSPNKRSFYSRKRLREWRDDDHHIVEKYMRGHRTVCGRRRDWSESSDRDRMERKERGYWRRDPSGSKELVFHSGSYETENKKETMVILRKVEENVRAEERENDNKGMLLEDQARQYQLEVLEQAKNRNTIAFLETGSGKTLIAILLLKNMSAKLKERDEKMLAVFLVPKIPLVYQQAEVIRAQTGFSVGHYCGDMGQNFWDARRWQCEFESKEVLVMTAQILLNILRHSIIKMERIHLLILDECHHAVKKHPYSLVMSEFYHTTPKQMRPSVFGMTASPVNLKGVSSQIDCAIRIRNLESKLDSTVCTVKDRKELEEHVPMPFELVVEYDKPACLWYLHEQIKQMELALVEVAKSSYKRSKWQFMGARDAGAKEELRQVYGLSERSESDGAANLLQKLRAIDYALAELGQWCAYKVALSLLTVLQNDEGLTYKIDAKFQELHLSKLVSLMQCELLEGAASENCVGVETVVDALPDTNDIDEIEDGEITGSHVVSGGEHLDQIMGAAVADGKVTPKVQSLIKILLKYKHTDDFRAIIFVERVVTALALPKVLAGLQSLSFIKCGCLIGHNNNQEMRASHMRDIIAKFRDGKVTLLVATSVAEEGLDIRQCNVVIRFDLARTVLAYIQSRGRARKPGSDYILMVERENASHAAFLRNARNSEETLRKEAIERTDISHLKDPRLIVKNPLLDTFYKVENTGAMVSLNSSVGLVHFYCSQLPCDRYSILRPEFIMERHEKPDGSAEYSCKLQLPCNAPFEHLEGPICNSLTRAQQAVCLAACKKLHEMGAFTDMLLPEKGNAEVEKSVVDDGDPLPGMVRYTEFYPEGVADILQGEWILSRSDTCRELKHYRLHVYTLKCTNIGSSTDCFLAQVSDFAVIFGNELDAEVLSMSVDLFVARSMITKASFLYRGPIDVTQDQLDYLKSFHVRLMSIVLDVDVEPATTPWDHAKAYLFVPLVCCNSTDPVTEINWDLIKNTVASHAWSNPLQRARPDVYLGTDERTLGGEKKEYGYSKLRRAYGQVLHPTYGVRGAVAPFDVVRASGLFPNRDTPETLMHAEIQAEKVMTADCCISSEELVGKIVTTVHSGKRFYVDSVCFEMTANNSFPKKDSYLDALEYKSYADYYKQKYGVELLYKDQPLIKGRGVPYCKNLLSPRFEDKNAQVESEEALEKMYYVFLPPELCLVHPLPGQLIRGAQKLPSIMRRVESMLLAVQLRDIISYPMPASKILEALTAASCQETYSYERAELLGDAYLKWAVSGFLFLKHPEKHEGQLTRMRQHMVSNMALYHYALSKGLQSYILADRFSPSRWAAPGVLPVFDEDVDEGEYYLFDSEKSSMETRDEYDDLEDGELDNDSSSYRVLSSKTLADVVEALIGVFYVEGGRNAANHLMKWVGIEGEFDHQKMMCSTGVSHIPDTVLKSVDFEALESRLNVKFHDRRLLVEALTHASRPTSGVSCYQRLEFVGDAVLDHLITKHLFFTYTDLPPGCLTDLRAAAVNNENFARVAVKHKLHLHLRHGSSALEKQIRDFVKEVCVEIEKSGFNSFGLGDCKAPKVLGDIIESIAGALFVDSLFDNDTVWRVFKPLLQPIVTPETLPLHPVRELQERCQRQAETLEYKRTRAGKLAIVEVFIDGVQIASAQNSQRKMAQKLAARNTLVALKEREDESNKVDLSWKQRNGSQAFVRQTLNDICLRRNWPMPSYRCVSEGGPAHSKRFTFAVRVNTSERGWTDECVGEPMPNVKMAKDSAAVILLQLLSKWYQVQ